MSEITTDHLTVDEGGGPIWITSLPDAMPLSDDGVTCGRITMMGKVRAEWPESLGEEPDWFIAELEDLERQWGREFDERRREARAYYQQACGDYNESRGTK